MEHVRTKSGLTIPREENAIIYVRIISGLESWTTQRPITYLAGNYLYII
jgi:hypothetical protein